MLVTVNNVLWHIIAFCPQIYACLCYNLEDKTYSYISYDYVEPFIIKD